MSLEVYEFSDICDWPPCHELVNHDSTALFFCVLGRNRLD